MSFLEKYLGEQNSAVASGDLANLANFPPQRAKVEGANKPNSTNIVSQVARNDQVTAASLQREARRQKILQLMAEDDQPRPYYFLTDTESHPDYVILAMAKRGVATWEFSIERERYDVGVLLDLIRRIERDYLKGVTTR